jgi:hypothetical protein
MILGTRHLFLRLLDTLSIDLVCDVGSMNGADALAFRRARPRARVVAFEPNPHNLEAMRADTRLPLACIELLPFAASDTDGVAPFHLVDADYRQSHHRRGMSSLHDPTLFTIVHDAGRRTALLTGESKLTMLAPPGSADLYAGPAPGNERVERGAAAALAARFAQDFAREGFALTLVHFDETDAAGHRHGWMSPGYLAAIGVADRAFGAILDAIAASGRAGATAVLVTTDHGGERDNHGIGRGETSWLIPFGCQGPGLAPARIAGVVTHLDLAPTVLALLGLPPLAGMEGRALPECLPSLDTPATRATRDER